MPPFGDCIEMRPLLLAVKDGEPVPFDGIKTIEIADTGGALYSGFTAEELCAPMEFSIGIRMKRGAFDILCGRYWTKAARRAIRWNKRHKEKQRRRKLKEANNEDYQS